jgi:hypothetical protein
LYGDPTNTYISNAGKIIVDIVVMQYPLTLEYDEMKKKNIRYVGTMVMAARVPPPTMEDIRAKIAKSGETFFSRRTEGI